MDARYLRVKNWARVPVASPAYEPYKRTKVAGRRRSRTGQLAKTRAQAKDTA